jgi:DNA-binding transcriptional MerR regulator
MPKQNAQNDLNLPLYNIKAISRLVGLPAVTLRAWERRYGLPVPSRGQQGYRLYSDYDLRTLLWLKSQQDIGLNISRAVEQLYDLRIKGNDPALDPIPSTQPASLAHFSRRLIEALERFDEVAASSTLRLAFSIFSIDQVLVEVIQPALVDLGEKWHQGDLPIAVEHFASQFCIQHLMSMLSTAVYPSHRGVILAACAPGEMHQIGLLMLVVMLRWRGWEVKYLGPDLALDRLDQVIRLVKPHMLLFSATRTETAKALEDLSFIFETIPRPAPRLILGGQAFRDVHLPASLPATILALPPTEAVSAIEHILLTPEANLS